MAFCSSFNPAQCKATQPRAAGGNSTDALRLQMSKVSLTLAAHTFMDSPSAATRPNTSPNTSPITSCCSFSGNRSLRVSHSIRSPSAVASSVNERCSTASHALPSRSVNSHGPLYSFLKSLNVIILARAQVLHFFSCLPGSSSSPPNLFRPWSEDDAMSP